MARTLGGGPNQVATTGRRVLLGWIGGQSPASQSLARDLSLSSDYELLQEFVPELQMLRLAGTHRQLAPAPTGEWVPHANGSLQLELVASFSWTGAAPTHQFGVSVLGGVASITVDCTTKAAEAPCMVTVNSCLGGVLVGDSPVVGPILPVGASTVTVHAIVDHEILETIVNNRTAMVTYHKNIPSASSTGVALFGAYGLTATISTWELDAANNAAPQP
jgi:sucrose-6-phosphate hydrolase SacC (GH32 family)